MRGFFDTSAFVKRYIEEPGSEKIIEICRQAEHMVLSMVCLLEMVSPLNRLVRERNLSYTEYQYVSASNSIHCSPKLNDSGGKTPIQCDVFSSAQELVAFSLPLAGKTRIATPNGIEKKALMGYMV
jgi:hypothetical protein